MCLPDVDDLEVRDVLVLLIPPVERGDVRPKRRSRATAKDQDGWPLTLVEVHVELSFRFEVLGNDRRSNCTNRRGFICGKLRNEKQRHAHNAL